MKTKNWYTIKEISKISNKSTRTVERKRDELLKNNPDLDWFKMKSKPYKYSFKMLNEFMSKEVFELIDRNRQLSNTIACMHRTETLEQHLSFLDWDYFITIAYEEPLSKKRCFTVMHKLYEKLEAYSFSGNTRMYFTTETYTNRKGYHNHFTLKMNGNKKLVSEFIKQYVPEGRIDIQQYDKELAALFYICKEGKNGEDWDLLGNNLSKEGKHLKQLKYATNIQ